MTQEEYPIAHKEFRTWLRVVRGQNGIALNNLVNTAERYLPTLIRENVEQRFISIYDSSDIPKLLSIAGKIYRHEDWLISNN